MRPAERLSISPPHDALLAPHALRRRRRELGLTQAELAHILGVTSNTMARWERGEQRVGNPAMVHLALDQLAGRAALHSIPTTVSTPRGHNLPNELSSFVGRDGELAHLKQLLPGTRLLTLAGTGGIGKTRLALRMAASVKADTEHYPDGVWLVELAALRDPALVPQEVAEILAPREQQSTEPLQRLIAAAGDKRLLLVLDNCEHLVAACAEMLGALLRANAGVRVLATSREQLGVAGEVTWRVAPLSIPSQRTTLSPTPEELSRSEAAQLLVERVTALQPTFRVTESNSAALAEICRRLEGIPLALELAAAHIPSLGPAGVISHLDDRFRLLVATDRTVPPRHQTLRATIGWSYALLDDRQRDLLKRLSVFAGGTTLDAAVVVCAWNEPLAVLPVLERLIAKSLVIAEPNPGGVVRYRMLETVRTYALERIEADQDLPAAQGRHAEHFTQLAEEAEPELNGSDQIAWLERLEQDHDNLRQALGWAVEHDVELGLRLAGALGRFWGVHGHLGEGAAWLDRLLKRASLGVSAAARAKALTAAGILAWHRAQSAQAEAYLRESVELHRDAPDDARLSRSLYELAKVLSQRGDHTSARALGEQALERWRSAGDIWGTAVALNFIGELEREEGKLAAAWRSYDEARRLFNLAGDQRGVAIATQNLGIVAIEQGDLALAGELHRSTLPLKRGLADREGLASSIVDLSYLVLLAGDTPRAVRLCSAAELAHESIGAVLPPYEEQLSARIAEQARRVLGPATFSTHWIQGRQMSLDHAIDEALAPIAAVSRSPGGPGALTRRQRDVAALIALGLTNRQLAARLVIAEGTAQHQRSPPPPPPRQVRARARLERRRCRWA